MKCERVQMVHREFNFGIVDEVDSILIDEARTPHIISGRTDDTSELYIRVTEVVHQLGEEDYEKDEKAKSISLTEKGTEPVARLPEAAGLPASNNHYDIEKTPIAKHDNKALQEHKK